MNTPTSLPQPQDFTNPHHEDLLRLIAEKARTHVPFSQEELDILLRITAG